MRFYGIQRRIAHRYLWARTGERFLSLVVRFAMIGIALGVATLIVVMAVMNGFREELMTRILGMNGHITLEMSARTDPFEVADRLSNLEFIATSAAVIDGQAIITKGASHHGVLARGMVMGDILQNPFLLKALQEPLTKNETGIIIGDGLAQRLHVTINDDVTLISPQAHSTILGGLPRMKKFKIQNIFNSDVHHYDDSLILMPLAEAQSFFKRTKKADYLEIRLNDFLKSEEAKRSIRARLIDIPQLRMRDWKETNRTLFSALEVERRVMFLILMLIIIIATFNIITGLSMLVRDKERDIAILRTLGMTKRNILHLFMIHGMTIGVIGTFCGAVLGILFADNIETIRQFIESISGARLFPQEIYFLSQLPAKLDVSETASVVIISLLLSFLATLHPAWRAASLPPARALAGRP